MQHEPDPSGKDPHGASHAFRRHFQRISAAAEARGMSRDAVEALIGIDACAFVWRRRMLKGELVRRILTALDCDIEPSEFEALTALSRLTYGIGCTPKADATIGDVAEELNIDPSRASRLVTALVQKGYVRRAIAQDDARKTILLLTKASGALLEAFMKLKWHLVIDAFHAWSDKDLDDFERLLSNYVATMSEAVENAATDQQIAAGLSERIKAAAEEELAARGEFA